MFHASKTKWHITLKMAHNTTFKGDFQSILPSLFVSLTPWNANQCYLFRTTYLIFEALSILFATIPLIFAKFLQSYKVVSSSDIIKKH